MKKITDFLTISFGKAIAGVLRLFGRDAGNFPGLVLWTLNRKYLRHFHVDCPIIAVTGTNGKTSTTNFLNKIFCENFKGKKIITNKQGNNLDTGIGSLLLQYCDMFGKVEADYLVLEIDESHVPVIFKYLKLDTLVVLNFFRDQLDRNGEVETLIRKVEGFLEGFDGNLILNADDPNVLRLGLKCPGKVYRCRVERSPDATESLYEVGEGRLCPVCAEELKYDYYQYSHIGSFRCPSCGYGSEAADFSASVTDSGYRSFSIDGEEFGIRQSGIYHIYNLTAAYAAACLYGVDRNVIREVFVSFEVNNGRLEKFSTDNASLTLNLAKNPVGANMTLRLINSCEGEKELLFVLNDNVADGLDVSWIWDINFSIFKGVRRVVTSGTRAYDIAVRIKSSGYDPERITVLPDLDRAVGEIFSSGGNKYAVANFTALQPTRQALKRYLSRNGGGAA